MILITGATGTIGSEVLRLLAGRGGVRLRAMTRDPGRVRLPAAAQAAQVVQADFSRPGTLRRAADGVDCVFLLTAPGAQLPDHDLAMIESARAAGARKIVKLSAIGDGTDRTNGTEDTTATGDDRALPADWHHPGEQALAAGDLAWSVLRPASFASNALHWSDAIRAGEPVPNMTGTGAQAVVDPRDVAAVAVEALRTEAYDGRTLTLTGPEALSVPDQAEQLAAELGRPVRTVDVPPEAARTRMLAAGLDPSVVDVAVRGYAFVRGGGGAVVTGDVERVLGRAARTFRSWARDHHAVFADGWRGPGTGQSAVGRVAPK